MRADPNREPPLCLEEPRKAAVVFRRDKSSIVTNVAGGELGAYQKTMQFYAGGFFSN